MIRVLICMMVFGASALNAQSWKVKQTIPMKNLAVSLDQLNNIYVLNRAEITKLDEKGKLLTQYSNKLIGEDIQVDVSNPMKVLVFSPDQMRLIFLDSRLGELREEVNLYREGYEQVSLAATSHSNGFWLYDPINFKLIRYDQNFKKERESLNLAQLLRVEFYPTDLLEVDNKVYLTDPRHGVFVFDVFGTYVKRIPILNIEKLKVANQRLFFQKGEVLYAHNLRDQQEEIVELDRPLRYPFDINRNRLALTNGKEIFILGPKL